MTKSKVWIIKNKPCGVPKLEDFQCIEEVLPSCGDGDVVIEAVFFSVDPYMRYRLRQMPVKSVVVGAQVARVIESKNKDFPVGTFVVGSPGWRTHSHLTEEQLTAKGVGMYTKLPEMGPIPKSTALGVLGMPGNTAYFGFLELCQPKAGDVVLVNAAAGAVGSLVCQIAKIKGCEVIAFAGSDDKIAWLKELGIDHVFNYKTDNVYETLKKVAPNGVNCYFDNVGGQFTAEALPHMADFGRVAICGCISSYNDESRDIGQVSLQSPYNEGTMLWKQLRVEGFLVLRWLGPRWMEGIGQMTKWLMEGKLKFKESITEGFENMPKAFIGLFSGENIGKAIVKA